MSGLERRQHGGFTLVEVMISIGIMTVGSLGILSMHSAVSGANKSAQEMNTALAITERWIERIERDTLSWSQQGLNTSELTGTDYLSPLATTVDKTDWLKPLPADTEESYGFDYFGGDTRDAGQIKYCTNLRLYWLRQGSSARVDVRTFWYREGHMAGNATHPQWVSGSDFRGAACDAATADGWNLGSAPNVNVIFASTVVTWLRRD
ncbi:MAG: prepilin-type N-terminal cleavage/methylation domain-containing protein [Deltaproteobacteria bacterium]|nr:prepilin-type N-terminal cleavage/methylation domain-containing protein [Deltaproteobacteria bacterium]